MRKKNKKQSIHGWCDLDSRFAHTFSPPTKTKEHQKRHAFRDALTNKPHSLGSSTSNREKPGPSMPPTPLSHPLSHKHGSKLATPSPNGNLRKETRYMVRVTLTQNHRGTRVAIAFNQNTATDGRVRGTLLPQTTNTNETLQYQQNTIKNVG